MIIEEKTFGAVTVLSPKGKMTLGDGDELLKEKIEGLIARGRKQIVLDLSGTPYVDSSGFGEIYRGFTKVVRSGGNLVLCNLTKRIIDLLTITKLMTISEVYDSVDEAVQRFQTTTFEIACPVCKPRRWQHYPGHAGRSTCPVCDVEFTFSSASMTAANRDLSESDPAWTIPIVGLSWRTYAAESDATDQVRLTPGEPVVITIKGRLDVFAFDVVETAWQAVPRPCCVLFDVRAVTAGSAGGWDKLYAICSTRDGGQRAAILAPDQPGETAAGTVTFVDYERALAELRARSGGPGLLATTIRARPT